MMRFVARAVWGVPVVLAALAANQAKVALDLKSTWENGEKARAEVVVFERSNRADVNYGYVSLRVPLGDGRVLQKKRMSLPHSLLPRLQGADTLEVRIRPGAAQEVVIDSLMPAHWLIAASQMGISALGAILFLGGAYGWSTFIRKRGDHERRSAATTE